MTTALGDLRDVTRTAWWGSGAVGRFAVIGMLSTAAYAMLYWSALGAMGPVAANALALLVTAIANTAANRRFTFGVRGRDCRLQHHAAGLLSFAVSIAITSGAAALLTHTASHTGPGAELLVLLAANVLSSLVRFLLLRHITQSPRTAHIKGETLTRVSW